MTSVWSLPRDSARRGFMRFLEATRGRKPLLPGSVDRALIKSILVIRQHDQLGDFLLATPALRAIRETFPAARIAIVVREYFQDVARMVPYVDEVMVFRERATRWSWSRGTAFYRRLRRGWDLTVVLNTVSHSLTSDVLASLSRARYVLGSGARVFAGSRRNFLYNLIAPGPDGERHQTLQNLDIVQYIGISTHDYSPRIEVPDSEERVAHRELEARGIVPGRRVIGFHLGAGKEPNRWPVARFGELAARLSGSNGAQVVLFWGPKEEDLRRQFVEQAGPRTVEAGHPELRKLAAMFRRCDALVCNDTGIMHLAAAAGVRLVAIFGPTDPEVWKPLGVRIVCLRHPSRRTGDVPVDEVVRALEEVRRFE
jgi:ADP-heptose:LPS heptosyltransferase